MTYPVSLKVDYPEKLSRMTTLLRIFMLITHAVVLYFLGIVAGVILFISWWAILFTGKYPRGLYEFVVYCFRWNTRFTGYSYLLTDKYPPFTGNE
jgi:hypothetical protein